MNQKKTQYDRLLERIKNNPVTVPLLIVGTIVIGIGTFISAINKITQFEIKTHEVEELPLNINGRWVSGIKPYYVQGFKHEYRYFTEITRIGDSITGVLLKEFIDISRIEEKSILDGKVQENNIKFHTKGEYFDKTNKRTAYVVRYVGEVVGEKINFVEQDDRGYSPVYFSLSRKE